MVCDRSVVVFAAIGVLAAGCLRAQDSDESLVLTALPVTFYLTTELANGTSIVVQNLPERGRRMNGLPNFFVSRAEQLNDTFARAEAVVTIGKIWSDDPLYTAARSANIRVVDIDATKPWSTTLEGISVALQPAERTPWLEAVEPLDAQHEPSPFFWLSPANVARSADIIAGDLMRLVPANAASVEANLLDLRRRLLDLQRRYELALALLPDVTVFTLAPEFVYLTSDFGLYVDGAFFKQDIDWTEQDIESFSTYLADNGIRVVLHKWEPEEPIADAITRAGATLVVLDTLDAGRVEDGRLVPESFIELLDADLSRLLEALERANQG
jgi:ABC-type Zn uptake system ZnuABC Zn-binding protein ZnuA